MLRLRKVPEGFLLGWLLVTIKEKIDKFVHVRVVGLFLNRNKPPAE